MMRFRRVPLRAGIALVVLAATAGSCATTAPSARAAGPDRTTAPGCRTAVDWRSPEGSDVRLDDWCRVVGEPELLHAGATSGPVSRVVVVSWNVGVGQGRLVRLLDQVSPPEAGTGTGVILLLQEAVRFESSVPEVTAGASDAPGRIAPPHEAWDIVAFARSAGLSLAYVPSMRNGRQASPAEDRGNAILSTHPLTGIEAIELPFGKQRRVAVAATVTMPINGTPTGIRVVSAHLDTNHERTTQARALAARLTGDTGFLLAGGDLNTIRGVNDEAFLAVAGAVPALPCGDGRTNAWPFRLDVVFGFWLGRFDHLFGRVDSTRWAATCRTEPDFFGSDHRPLVLELQLLRREGDPVSSS